MITFASSFALALTVAAAPPATTTPAPGGASSPAPGGASSPAPGGVSSPATGGASSAAPAPAASPASASPPADAKSATDERLLKAEKLYKARKYVESARELESLWADTKQPNALYNAALARFAAGHYSHAISYLESYISTVKDAPTEAMDLAKFQLAKAKERSAEVPVIVGPASALTGGAELTIRRVPESPEDRRPDLHYTIPAVTGDAQATLAVYLDAGRWSASVAARGFITPAQEITIARGKPEAVVFTLGSDPRMREASFRVDIPADAAVQEVVVTLKPTGAGEARTCTVKPFAGNECRLLVETGTYEIQSEAPGFQPYRQVITLTSGEGPASYTLPLAPEVTPEPEPEPEPAPTDTVPKPVRMRLAGGLNASGLPIFVTGLGLAVYGSNQYDRSVELDASKCATPTDNLQCRTDLIKAVDLRTAGLSLVGVATGLFVTGLTGEFDVKERVWYAEIGTGAALLVGGAAWMGVTTGGLNRNLHVTEGGAAPDWEASLPAIDRTTNQRLAAGMLLGTGIGLVTGGTVGLLVRRHYAKKKSGAKAAKEARVAPFMPYGGAGVALSGRF